jgi:hypothetical protein
MTLLQGYLLGTICLTLLNFVDEQRMATKTLEEKLHDEMVDLYSKTGREAGYWAHRYLQKVKRVGGLNAAHDWLKPELDSTSGLQRLMEKNRIDLSLEALVLRNPWSSLFTSEELQVAQKRLNSAASLRLPEEVFDETRLLEGAVCQITINQYERNPEARRRCLEYYGTSCCVCGFNFGQVFGTTAEGFIHVHHLTPLSKIGEEYTVDPIEDLRPVCPNCHAMIHLGGTTRDIEELKAILRG